MSLCSIPLDVFKLSFWLVGFLEEGFVASNITSTATKRFIEIAPYGLNLFGFIVFLSFVFIVLDKIKFRHFCWRYSLLPKRGRVIWLEKLFRDNPLDQILYNAYVFNRALIFSLDNQKVYIGYISEMGEPNENSFYAQELSIVPLLSGYRTPKKQRVKYTTDYEEIDPEEDIYLVIRRSNIVSVTQFDKKAFMEFNTSALEEVADE